MRKMRWFLILLAVMFLVVGCNASNVQKYLSDKYSLVDVVDSRYTDEAAYVYEVGSVSQTATDLANKFKPKDMTEEANEERIILVYEEEIVDIYNEGNKNYAEVVSKQYVRDHYDSGSFFQGYLAASLIRDIFDGPRSYGYGGYTPFPSRQKASDYGRSVRQGSVGSKTVTGGGLFGGK